MKIKIITLFLFFIVAVLSCFEDDQSMPPYTSPYKGMILEQNIYFNQIYLDLGSDAVVSFNDNSEWDLAFESAAEGHHLRLNTSNLLGIARTGATRMDSVYSDVSGYEWVVDRPDGNPDSTAIGRWFTINGTDTSYSKEVFIVGTYNGLVYTPFKKIQLLSVDENSYKCIINDPESIETDTTIVLKDYNTNNVLYSLKNNSTISLEPLKDAWDLLFCQYHTILYTDEGIRTNYYVRGTLLNPNAVEAGLDTINNFDDIDYDLALQTTLSSKLDIIGHDWKSVEIDEATNASDYKVRPGYSYIIKDTDNQYYKLMFTGFYNTDGIKGYPSFEYSLLEP